MNKTVKKFIVPLAVFSVLFTPFLGSFVFAQQQQQPGFNPSEIQPTSNLLGCATNQPLANCLANIGWQVLRFLMFFALIAAAVLIVWAGVIFIARGDQEPDQKKARQKIIWASVGLVVAFLAYAVAEFLRNIAQEGTGIIQ